MVVTAHVPLKVEKLPVRGGGEKVVVTDEDGLVVELVVLGAEDRRFGRVHKNVRLTFKAPWSRPKVVGLWGGKDSTVVVMEPHSSDEWRGPLRVDDEAGA